VSTFRPLLFSAAASLTAALIFAILVGGQSALLMGLLAPLTIIALALIVIV
jgi:hypothetical protein